MSCVEIMTRRGNEWQLGNSSSHARGEILCVEKTDWNMFYQFHPQGFLKMADDWTGSGRDVCSRLLSQSMNGFCVVIDIVINCPTPIDAK